MKKVLYNKVIKKTLAAICLLSAMFTVASCNNTDDLNAIFIEQRWTVALFSVNNVKTPPKGIYKIQFFNDSFTATTPKGAVISGNWEANGNNNSRAFRCTKVRVSEGSITGDTTAIKMKSFLEKANSYEGTTTYLLLKQSNNTYIQFHSR